MTEKSVTPGCPLVDAAFRAQRIDNHPFNKKNPNLFIFVKVIIDWLKAKPVTNHMGMSVIRLD